MASLWQRKKTGIWCVTYRDNRKQRVRSLRTKDKREALRLKREIETILESKNSVSLQAKSLTNDDLPSLALDEFWDKFRNWAVDNRSTKTLEEYENWFNQFTEFTDAIRMDDVSTQDFENFKNSLLRQGKRKPKGVGFDAIPGVANKVLQWRAGTPHEQRSCATPSALIS